MQGTEQVVQQVAAACEAALAARGPDHVGSLQLQCVASCTTAGQHQQQLQQLLLHLAASLLQLRGSSAAGSPLVDGAGNVLCFNGEVFGGLHVPPAANDAACLLDALARLLADADAAGAQHAEQQQQQQQGGERDSVPALLSRLRGPWALLYWQQASQTLWFGRDVMGEPAR